MNRLVIGFFGLLAVCLITSTYFLLSSGDAWSDCSDFEGGSCPILVDYERIYLSESSSPLLNLTNFAYVWNNESICSESSSVKILLVLVHTARAHTKFREVIRKTWASIKTSDLWSFRIVFLIGLRNSRGKQNYKELVEEEWALEAEYNNYGDIVMGNFIDTYRNLSYKHLMAYRWTVDFCPQAEFVWKIDDDMVLDLPLLAKIRDEEIQKLVPVPNLYCNSYNGVKPDRNTDSKWFLSYDEFPDEFYPNFCLGPGIGLTVDLMRHIYSVHQKGNFLWVDDAFVTGVLAAEALKEYKGNFTITKRNNWDKLIRLHQFKYNKEMCSNFEGNGTEHVWPGTLVWRKNSEDFERDVNCVLKIMRLKDAGLISNVTS